MRLFAVLSLALVAASPLRADVPSDLARLEVLPGWRAVEGRHIAALRLVLAPGWKTYWRAPGEAGLPPAFDFAGSSGIRAVEPRWPVPDVFHFNGMRSIGYGGEVTIPLDLAVTEGEARLEGVVEIGVCHDVCVPLRLPFAADLPEGGTRDPRIAAALVDRPLTPEEAGAEATCAVVPEGAGLGLTLHVAMPPLGPEEAVVIEAADPALWISEPVARREGAVLVARAEALATDGGAAALDRSGLRITVLGGGKAVDIRGCAPA
ncbi:protein-disulfide reductase DsbD domain-containing protein [Rubellimicrobium sp. CFH 75288]|uniref:protein-disulfide reductase DsbD domain-containing protein n=1 Tax=Rubellimicrobium sp. CFH 75288 TaxID=2697034 RepID=UPI0014129782|nr:protein-disulfide reductase DsbD domain-containing protein [Rubellimicrobium sp. CFH 75288]NAZ37996.1 hypothetical protein [Rubellimicrobium sp. CFH 75288]